MAYHLEDLLKGLDEPTIKNVTEHVKAKAKELQTLQRKLTAYKKALAVK